MNSRGPKQEETDAERRAKEQMAAEEARLKKISMERANLRRSGKVGFESLLSTGFRGRGGLINPIAATDLSSVLGG